MSWVSSLQERDLLLAFDITMLLKSKDDISPTIAALEVLLARKDVRGKQRQRIEEEIDQVRAGAWGEKDAAYHIDFKLKDTKNWVVIHDLRLEHDGRVAQIDHLLIGRMFDIFVVESKNLKTAVRVNGDGEFEVKTRYGWKGMSSPVEQNKRHIQVLSGLISDEKLTPTRLGMQIRPTFHNWVLIAPECNLVKGDSKEATILKMDMFDKGMEQRINDAPLSEMFSLAKICSQETIMAFAEKLVSFHKPIVFDYAAKFGITEMGEPVPTAPVRETPAEVPVSARSQVCEHCLVPVEPKVVSFCRMSSKRFGGKILCRTCQTAQVTPVSPVPIPEPISNISEPTCQECSAPVDAKVVAFCRFNSRRFGKRVLCRTCQANAAVPVS